MMVRPLPPPGTVTTVLPTINGDTAMPTRSAAPASYRTFVRQRTLPLDASSALNSPVAPSTNSVPSWNAGVARGPGPPPLSGMKTASHALVHRSRPVRTSYATATSWSPRCSIVNACPFAATNDACPPPTGCRHNGCSALQSVRIGLALYRPSRRGPRNPDQSVVQAIAGVTAGAAAAAADTAGAAVLAGAGEGWVGG